MLTILGVILILLAVLGFIGLIASTLVVEIVLLVAGLLVIAFANGHLRT